VDTETASALERVIDRIETLETSVHDDIAQARDEFRAELAAQGNELRAAIAEQVNGLRTEFRNGLADVRRHAVVLNESTRDDIRLVAEAVAVLALKVDSLQR
jgi:predicted ATP-binding protein involved in virulence